MPPWVEEAITEFSKRIKKYAQLKLIEIPLIKRGKSNDLTRILEKESNLVLSAIPGGSYVIALAINGTTFSSEKLTIRLQQLQQITSHLCFLIGGPEGLTQQVMASSHERWSLSNLTLPHPLARILLLETLYRSYTILHNHPYHK